MNGEEFRCFPDQRGVLSRVTLRSLFGATPDEFESFEEIMSAAMLYFEGVARGLLVQQSEFTRQTTAPLRLRASVTARPRDPLILRLRRIRS